MMKADVEALSKQEPEDNLNNNSLINNILKHHNISFKGTHIYG